MGARPHIPNDLKETSESFHSYMFKTKRRCFLLPQRGGVGEIRGIVVGSAHT